MGVAKVTRNYQVTIPRDVRVMHNIEIGDTLVFSMEGDKVEILKLKVDILEKTFGSWSSTEKTGIAYTKEIRKEWHSREKRIIQEK